MRADPRNAEQAEFESWYEAYTDRVPEPALKLRKDVTPRQILDAAKEVAWHSYRAGRKAGFIDGRQAASL